MILVTLFANLSFTMQEIKKTECNIMHFKNQLFKLLTQDIAINGYVL